MPMSPEQQMPRNGFVGRMPQGQPQPQQMAMPQEQSMGQFGAIMQELSGAIKLLAQASMAESETYRTTDGTMRVRKVMAEAA